MHYLNKKLCYSPTDLTLFMSSSFASWMNRFALEYPDKSPEKDPEDGFLDVLQNKGFEHEEAQEALLRSQGLQVQKIEADTIEQKKLATLAAMNNGVDVIVQAYLEKGAFFGYADFLVKVPGQSQLGDYYYEVWDTKLSHKTKPEFLIQLSCYADMLATMQGKQSDSIVVVLGDGKQNRFKLNDYFYYYLSLKESFLLAQKKFNANQIPCPSASKEWGCWSTYAERLLCEKDHLYYVANITTNQIKKLNKASIVTVQQLIESKLEKISGMNASIFRRLKDQARIQKESVGKNKPNYKIIIPELGKLFGLALLPPQSSLDVFFDIEGFPLEKGGLEYLWGCAYFDDNCERCFKDFWAHDHDQERNTFQQFIMWVYERWQQDPTMHIYHYANYEIAACRKLMGRYGVCENELDQLLLRVLLGLYIYLNGLHCFP